MVSGSLQAKLSIYVAAIMWNVDDAFIVFMLSVLGSVDTMTYNIHATAHLPVASMNIYNVCFMMTDDLITMPVIQNHHDLASI